MPPLSTDFIRRIRTPTYLIVAFLSLGSAVEVLAAGFPPRVHDVNWRLSVLNSAAGATGTELLALLILIVVAQIAASGAALWTSFWLSLLMAVGYAGAAVTFLLDALQVRARIPGGQMSRFDFTVGWSLARFVIAEIVCWSLAAGALAIARSRRREMARESNRLIVGTSAGSAPAARADA